MILQDQEMKDGRTADGREIEAANENEDGEVCSKCMKVGKDLLLCSVSFLTNKFRVEL